MDVPQSTGQMPTESELVAFEHGAAGHQGLSSNAAGDLIIKPCTQAEIDFYEAAKDHPEFQAHMPTYMGKLELGSSTATQAMAPATQQGITAPTVTTEPASEAAEEKATKETGASSESKEKEWVPSGGKKLGTGLALVLENATAGFTKPNVLDLKLGARLWDDDAPISKRQKLDQVAAETTSGSLGFRVAGMKIWLGQAAADQAGFEIHTEIKDGYKSYDKNYGRSLDEHTVERALAQFIAGGLVPTTTYGEYKSWFGDKTVVALARRLIREVESIRYVLEHEESRMYSASIMVVIEGDATALHQAMAEEQKIQERAADARGQSAEQDDENDVDDEDDDMDDSDDDLGPRVMEVRLIDFAHAAFTPGRGPDENVLRGVRNVVATLDGICS